MNGTIFPVDIPDTRWSSFHAEGYDGPVVGVVYKTGKEPCCGVALGGLGTGCIDIDPRGIYGFSSIFNPVGPRPGYPGQLMPRLLPEIEAIFGLSVGGKTWVLASPEILRGGELEWCTEPDRQLGNPDRRQSHRIPVPNIENVDSAREIRYWGHYPVVDMEFTTDAPVSVGMRAWAPFIPGDAVASNIPAIVFCVSIRNTTTSPQQGTIAFNFPGPQAEESPATDVMRTRVREDFEGILVNCPQRVSYLIGVLGQPQCRFGGGMRGSAAS